MAHHVDIRITHCARALRSNATQRDAYMRAEGWTVFRVWNSDVRENPVGTTEAILARAAECLGGTHPQPLPSRERRVRRRRYE
jgi:very-short-patch-repair endonuclease